MSTAGAIVWLAGLVFCVVFWALVLVNAIMRRFGADSLPVGVTTFDSSRIDILRNRIAGRVANFVLRFATPEYRDFIGGAIRYGLRAAIEDVRKDGDV